MAKNKEIKKETDEMRDAREFAEMYSKEDVFSGNGLNFLGEKNYIVTTMECYKSIQEDIRSGKLNAHIEEWNAKEVKV